MISGSKTAYKYTHSGMRKEIITLMYEKELEALQIEDPEERRRRLIEVYKACIESDKELMQLANSMNDTELENMAKSSITSYKRKLKQLKKN